MFTQLREVSIAVRDLEEAMETFQERLGLTPEEVQTEAEPPIESRFASFRVGSCSVALMESLREGSAISRFIQRRGEGLFSITLAVDDLNEAMRTMRDKGVEFVLEEPLVLRNIKAVDKVYSECIVNFTTPKSLHGVVIEVQELRE